MGTSGVASEASERWTRSADERPRLMHQPALDGLRGLAVAGVLLFHGGHLTGGFLGVDAFFVLSGFLITSLLLAEARDRGRIALGAFWARRARRLLPALVVRARRPSRCTHWLLAKPDELSTIRGDALATIGYFANWRAIFTSRDYWALFRSPSPLEHTWSLAIEEQFYLVWPLLVVAVVRGCRGRIAAQRVLVASVVLALASLDVDARHLRSGRPVARLLRHRHAHRRRSSSAPRSPRGSRLRGPVAGASRARRTRGGRDRVRSCCSRSRGRSRRDRRTSCTAAASSCAHRGRGRHRGRGAPAAAGRSSRVLSFRPLCALGLISYGVYLWHWPIYVVLDESRVHLAAGRSSRSASRVTLAVAVVSYRFVEQPIRHGARDRGRPLAGSRSRSRPRSPRRRRDPRRDRERTGAAGRRRRSDPAAPPIRPPARSATHSGQVHARAPATRARRRQLDRAVHRATRASNNCTRRRRLDVLNLGSVGCRLLPEETRSRYPERRHLLEVRRTCVATTGRSPCRSSGPTSSSCSSPIRPTPNTRSTVDGPLRASALRRRVRTRAPRADPAARVEGRARHRDDRRRTPGSRTSRRHGSSTTTARTRSSAGSWHRSRAP